MLCLKLRPEEMIWIGENVQVRFIGMDGNKARIGVVAPPEIRVDREVVRRRRIEDERCRRLGLRVEGGES